jgi:hypothetical protein
MERKLQSRQNISNLLQASTEQKVLRKNETTLKDLSEDD